MNLAKMRSFEALSAGSERDARILHTLPIVKKLTRRLWFRTNQQYPFEDLFMEGCVAATEAVDAYQVVEGAAFETYIHLRVWGGIVNYLRRVSNCRVQGFSGFEQFAVIADPDEGAAASAEDFLPSKYQDPETAVITSRMVNVVLDPAHSSEACVQALRYYILDGNLIAGHKLKGVQAGDRPRVKDMRAAGALIKASLERQNTRP